MSTTTVPTEAREVSGSYTPRAWSVRDTRDGELVAVVKAVDADQALRLGRQAVTFTGLAIPLGALSVTRGMTFDTSDHSGRPC